jgi:CRISPR-associated protein Cas1
VTVKGNKNHFNVKFLNGYGFSITLHKNKIILKDGQNILTKTHYTESWFVKEIPYEKIILSGNGYLSSNAISLLNHNKINLIITDTFGNPTSFLNGAMVSNTTIKNRMGQYDTFRDQYKVLSLQRWILQEKLQSQIDFLSSLNNSELDETISKIKFYNLQIDSSVSLHKIEASSARVYFMGYAKLIPNKFKFESRRGGGLINSKKNATNIINALLNYGYTVLAGSIAKFVNGFGLDPYYGFNHKADTSFQALVYDMIEPFRWLVEYVVYRFATLQTNGIRLSDYVHTKNGFVVMDSTLIRRFLESLERKFQSEREYSFVHGRKMKNGLSMCQEITICKIFVQKLINNFT